MMRVVVDTNVFVSSFFGGNPRKIIDLWKSGNITLCLTGAIINEYVEVLQRLGLQDTSELEELLKLFSSGYHTIFTSKTKKIHAVEKDPDDDKFIECAATLNAQYIITGDKALRDIGDYMGIKVVTPREFLTLQNFGVTFNLCRKYSP
jgi:putative PIN family toxin of toxin-antitoxin system